MSGPSPAAEFAEQIFVRRPNSSRDRKLFLRVPSATHPTGDDGPCEALVRGERDAVSIRSQRRYEVGASVESRAAASMRGALRGANSASSGPHSSTKSEADAGEQHDAPALPA